MIHFTHRVLDQDPRAHYETTATVHLGSCFLGRPCVELDLESGQTGTIQVGPETQIVAVGRAACSKRDVIDKAKGRKIALSRALAALGGSLGLEKDERRHIWRAYHHRVGDMRAWNHSA